VFQRIATVEQVPPGHTRYLRIGNRPLILANREGEIYALSGICPHQKNPLEGATLWDYLLDCPWHHFQYDVRTGENHFPKNVYPSDMPQLLTQLEPLRTYRVEVRNNEIWVDLT
jgi:3-phenylpropionate/trans-cinnamate dioxygenase ferredoxin component